MSSNGNHLNTRLLDGVQAARDSVPLGLERYYSVLKNLKDAGYTEAVRDISRLMEEEDPEAVRNAMKFYLENHHSPDLDREDNYHT